MNVAGPLVKGVLKQPINNVDNVGVIGVRRFVTAQLKQLLQVGDRRDLKSRIRRLGDGPRHGVKLDRPARDIRGIGDDAPDLSAPQRLLQHRLPLVHVGLRARDHHVVVGNFNGQDLVPLRKRVGHDLRCRINVDLQRIDTEIGLSAPFTEPAGEKLDVQGVARLLTVLVFPRRHDLERVLGKLLVRARRNENVFRLALTDKTLFHQLFERAGQIQQALALQKRIVRRAVLRRREGVSHG